MLTQKWKIQSLSAHPPADEESGEVVSYAKWNEADEDWQKTTENKMAPYSLLDVIQASGSPGIPKLIQKILF